jgi:hypothetical protein
MLERAGWPGETLTEKLEKASVTQMPDLDKVIKAHEVSERLVSDPIFSITYNEALQILLTYENTFQNFGLIEK